MKFVFDNNDLMLLNLYFIILYEGFKLLLIINIVFVDFKCFLMLLLYLLNDINKRLSFFLVFLFLFFELFFLVLFIILLFFFGLLFGIEFDILVLFWFKSRLKYFFVNWFVVFLWDFFIFLW